MPLGVHCSVSHLHRSCRSGPPSCHSTLAVYFGNYADLPSDRKVLPSGLCILTSSHPRQYSEARFCGDISSHQLRTAISQLVGDAGSHLSPVCSLSLLELACPEGHGQLVGVLASHGRPSLVHPFPEPLDHFLHSSSQPF